MKLMTWIRYDAGDDDDDDDDNNNNNKTVGLTCNASPGRTTLMH